MLICFVFLSTLYSQQEEEKKKIDKYFNMTLQEMMEVEIVTAGRSPEKVGDIPASVVLITREEIETYGYRTLAEILENITGLYNIEDYSENGSNFGVRGFWSGVPNDNMIILVNDIPQADDFQSNYPLTKLPIPVEAIDRIEVVRGPMSVIYGQGAFYGVINIFTNDITEKSSNMLSFSAGKQETKKIYLRCADSQDDFKYVFNASISDYNGIDEPIINMVNDVSILPLYGIGADYSTGGRLEGHNRYFNFFGSFKNFYFDFSHSRSNKETYFLYPSPFEGNQGRHITTIFSLGYKKEFSDTLSFNGKLIYSQGRGKQNYDFLFKDFYGVQQLESNAWEADLNLFINPSDNLEIKTGIDYRAILDTSNMYNLPSFGAPTLVNTEIYLSDGHTIQTLAIFSQISYKPFSNFNLVTGVRLEQMPKYSLEAIYAGGTEYFSKVEGTYDQDKIELIPRVAAIYSLNEKNIFKFLYGMAINRPSFYQNSRNSLDPLRDDLKPEKIQTYEINYIGAYSAKFTIRTSLFHNILENLITRVVKFDGAVYQTWSDNAGKMVTNGMELTLNSEPFKNLKMELSGTYQETDDKRPGYENIETAYSPNFLGYIKIAYRTKKFTLSLTGNYVGPMETFWDETIINSDGSNGDRIGNKVDGYFLLGTNLRIEDLFTKGLYLNFRCYNLNNTVIRYPTFTNNQWATRGTVGEGLSFLFSIGWKF